MKIFEFQKERSLDNIIEASFKLLRKHFKPMFSILWKYNAVLIVLFFSTSFLFNYYLINKVSSINKKMFSFESTFLFNDTKTILAFVFFIVLAFVFYNRFYATIMGYIRVYMENEGIVEEEKVKKYIDRKFWKLIGLTSWIVLLYIIFSVVFVILVVAVIKLSVGFALFLYLLLFIAIIYISVPLTISFPALFFDDISVRNAISYGFKYVKNKWWYSFFILLLMIIILWIIGLVVEVPVYLYDYIKELSVIKETSYADIDKGGRDIIYSSLSTLSLIVEYILKTAFLFTISLLFFSLKEYHTQEGILSKIDQIGQKSKDEK